MGHAKTKKLLCHGLAIAKSFTELRGGTLEVLTDADLFTVQIVFPKP